MTIEMLNMSKEELITAIANLDKGCRELLVSEKTLRKSRADLLTAINKPTLISEIIAINELRAEVEKIDDSIERGQRVMHISTIAIAEMRELLKNKYGYFVM